MDHQRSIEEKQETLKFRSRGQELGTGIGDRNWGQELGTGIGDEEGNLFCVLTGHSKKEDKVC